MVPRPHLFRDANEEHEVKVTPIELFFDLVFVFAITQLSHRLLEHLSLHGALETLILFLAVWWVWIYTSWTTNWLDPDRAHVRLLLMTMMAGGLVMSTAITKAFDKAGLAFAAAYCGMQLFRTIYMVWASRGVNEARRRNFLRIAFWFLVSLPFWVAGAIHAEMRLGLWALALAIEYAGPFARFATPVLGRSGFADWDIAGGHLAERCALFIIIALGETILVTGATFAKLEQDSATWLAFLSSVAGSATMWWIYFDIGAGRGSKVIEAADNAGLIARNAYTYLHMPIVAGVIVTAVADELMLAHPHGHIEIAFLATAIGGPLLFLIGNQAFKWSTAGAKYPPLSHFVGMLLLIGSGAAAWFAHWQPLTLGIAATGALIATAVWEWLSLHGGWQRWAPWAAPFFSRLPGPPPPS